MRALFLADAHLRRPTDANYRALLDLLDKQCGRLDLLVLLGDLFEFWAGDRKVLHASYQPLLAALERLTGSGTRLICVEGNHDFDLGRHFRDRLGARVLADGGSIELDGQQVFLAHGDLANPDDRGYLLLRRLLRSAPLRLLIRHLPIDLVLAIAMHSSRQSRARRNERGRQERVRRLLTAYADPILAAGHDLVVTGHFHLPLRLQLPHGELIALGDWIAQYSFLSYTDGRFELQRADIQT
ncbi:MAG: UDP-2,3-diacylglucosamine diphosphatase [Desulfuromonadales bacterium]|nr:UDP-2,3-diacylglucosamine diphosphatase [Desulfuromonadales bacterium]